jgi:hypothetical protein
LASSGAYFLNSAKMFFAWWIIVFTFAVIADLILWFGVFEIEHMGDVMFFTIMGAIFGYPIVAGFIWAVGFLVRKPEKEWPGVTLREKLP